MICKIDFALENTDKNDFLTQNSVDPYMYKCSYEQCCRKRKNLLSH